MAFHSFYLEQWYFKFIYKGVYNYMGNLENEHKTGSHAPCCTQRVWLGSQRPAEGPLIVTVLLRDVHVNQVHGCEVDH